MARRVLSVRPRAGARARTGSRALPTIEINGSFYSLQRPSSYAAWYDATPPGFVFAVKGNRFLTHMLKLRGIETPLANVLASGMFALREKLGPILWQFPPQLRFDADRVERFLSLLPHDTGHALAIARGHDEKLAFLALLRKYGVALVVADTAGKWPDIDAVTADFVYVRLHGEHELYASGYDDESLARWAARIRAWAKDGDVYCYFDNDIKVRAPFDAKRLMEMVGWTARPSTRSTGL